MEGTSPSRRAPFDPPGVLVASVSYAGSDGRFTWSFSAPYDESDTADWSAADFAPLRIGGHPPLGIDAFIGSDGILMLFYDFDPPPPGLLFEVGSPPAVLHFDGGQPLAVPQGGEVT